MAITSCVKEKIENELKIRLQIASAMLVGERTVLNWVKTNSPKLETEPVIAILKKETGMSKSEILETTEAA